MLTGTIPVELGNIPNLLELDLSRNQISGNIPSEIANLDSLRSLNLSQNFFSGIIPLEIGNIPGLQFLRLAENQFIDMPNYQNTPMTATIEEITVQNNQLTFEDIEPNVNIAQQLFIYSPQDSIGNKIDTTIFAGITFEMSVSVGGDSNYYQWLKEGIDIPGADSSTFIVQTTDSSDSGVYTCRITNSLATELTLFRRPIQVNVSGTVGIPVKNQNLPKNFKLEQNFPNPFNPVTVIRITIPYSCSVSLVIFNILGEQVATIYDDHLPAGEFDFNWNASGMSSGIYWYRLQAGNYTETRKMVLMR
jgi:hypothetical protein